MDLPPGSLLARPSLEASVTQRIVRTLTPVLALTVAVFASASQPEPQKPPLTFGAEIGIMAIPVFVTDKDGRSVAGLTAQDFEIEDGGKPASVQGFAAITGDGDVPSARSGMPVSPVSRSNSIALATSVADVFGLPSPKSSNSVCTSAMSAARSAFGSTPCSSQ